MLNDIDVQNLCKRYHTNFNTYGVDAKSLEWGQGGRQEFRFQSICNDILADKESSVLDIGCGFADLFAFLTARGWQGKYCGVDLCEDFVAVAREKYSSYNNFTVKLCEFTRLEQEQHFDYITMIGIHYIIFDHTDPVSYYQKNLNAAFLLCNKAIIADFMSSYVDYKANKAFHVSPEDVFSYAKTLTKRVALLHSYMPYEFCIKLFKNDSITEINTFLPL